MLLKTDTKVYQDEKAEHESKLVDLKRSVNEAASELELATNEHAAYRRTGEEQAGGSPHQNREPAAAWRWMAAPTEPGTSRTI